MKIGILSQNKEKNITGINRVTLGLMNELLKLDKSNEYCFVGKTDWLSIPLNSIPMIINGGKVFSIDFPILSHPVDIVHSHYRPFLLNDHIPCAKILTIHDLIPLIYKDWYASQFQYFDESIRECANRADVVIAVSNSTKQDIIKYYGISDDKIKVVYNGLYPPKMFDSKVQSVPLERLKGNRFLLSVSGVGPHKNQVGLAEAFIKYKQTHKDDDLKLVLTGPVRRFQVIRDILEKYPKESEDIIMTGFVRDEELLWLYQNALAFIYVSYYEGFGLPILEALSVGKAVITSDCSSMPEVGGNAVEYCDPKDIESIAVAIERVVTDDAYRLEKEQAARKQAEKFSYKKAARETLEIYQEFQR